MDSIGSGAPAAPRRLRGHKASASCCIASPATPGVVFTAGEDGCVCLFDLRSKDAQLVMELGLEPISSLCFKQGYEDIIFVSMGTEVKSYDVRLVNSSNPLMRFNYNKDEINQIACNSKSTFLAAADDSGDVKIIDIGQKCMFKTLRAGHSTICSSVQFLPWKAWEVVTGGLDSKLVLWDFSKARPFHAIDFGIVDVNQQSGAQCCNPAFVHALAVLEVDMNEKLGKICTVARGDGVVSVINLELELASLRKKSGHKPPKGSQIITNEGPSSADHESQKPSSRNRLHLDYSMGGHTAAASCVTFSSFGEKGKLLISEGNDKTGKAWDWSRYFDDPQTSEDRIMPYNINLPKKVNWLFETIQAATKKSIQLPTIIDSHADQLRWDGMFSNAFLAAALHVSESSYDMPMKNIFVPAHDQNASKIGYLSLFSLGYIKFPIPFSFFS